PAKKRKNVHLYGYDQVNVVNRCMLGLSKGNDVIIKGSVQLKDQAPSAKWRVFMEVRRYFSTTFKRFCSINLSRCEELRYPSKCYCKRKPNSLNFDIYFNFTLDVIHSHAEIRMKLLTDNTPVYSNVKRLPTIYQQVPLTLTVNGFEVEPRNCIFKVNASDPKVEFCCDADHLPCYSAIMRNGQVVADFNSSCAVLEDARPLRASYVFKYNVCSEKDKKLQFACKPLL
uniref:Uncharacterized protein n=1 Tax=Biomphalaria glabrata TaxID=6526 RepID=A0A2C9L1W3_BIOGL